MTRTLVTGAAGFTGRYMVQHLAGLGCETHGLVRSAAPDAMPGAAPGAAQLHACDLLDVQGLTQLLRRVRPRRVVHLAAIAFVAHGDVQALYRTNLWGTRCLLEALLASGIEPESVLLASSANVYGNGTPGAIRESAPAAPANDYAVSKLAMEHLAGLYASRLPLIISRPFNYTGVGQSEKFLLPKIVRHVRERAAHIELGNLDVARDFSDVRSVVHSYARLLGTPAALGHTFNVCSGQAHTLEQLLALAQRLAGHEMQVRVNPAFVRADEVKVLCGNRDALIAAVGAVPEIGLEQTLRWMIES